MADPDTEALQRRVAVLEAQLALLTQAITADRAGNVTITSPGSFMINCGGNIAVTAGISLSLTAGAATSINTGGALAMAVGSSMSLSVGGRIKVGCGQEFALDARYYNLSAAIGIDVASGQKMSIKAGKTLAISAADTAELKCGLAGLDLKKDGTVNVRGRDMAFQASRRFTVKASSDVILKGHSIQQN